MSADEKSEAKIERTEAEWREHLSPEQYHVLRNKGTERAFTGALIDCKDDGTYVCAGCGAELFASDTKFDSGSGWPSFFDEIEPGRIARIEDSSHGMHRVEITCARCDSHLGHVFPDGPKPTGERHCVNSLSLEFRRREEG